MAANKLNAVVAKTTLKFLNSDASVYCLTPNGASETVLLLPVKPLATNLSIQPIATSHCDSEAVFFLPVKPPDMNSSIQPVATLNSAVPNPQIKISNPDSHAAPLSWTVLSQEIQSSENLAQESFSLSTQMSESGSLATFRNLASESPDFQYSSMEGREPSGSSPVNSEKTIKIEDEFSTQMKDELVGGTSSYTVGAENASIDGKKSEQVESRVLLINMFPSVKEDTVIDPTSSSSENACHLSTSVKNSNTTRVSLLYHAKKNGNSDPCSSPIRRTFSAEDVECSIENIHNVVKNETMSVEIKKEYSPDFNKIPTVIHANDSFCFSDGGSLLLDGTSCSESMYIVQHPLVSIENSAIDLGNIHNTNALVVMGSGNFQQIGEHSSTNLEGDPKSVQDGISEKIREYNDSVSVENSSMIKFGSIRQLEDSIDANSGNSTITDPNNLESIKKYHMASVQNSGMTEPGNMRKLKKNTSESSENSITKEPESLKHTEKTIQNSKYSLRKFAYVEQKSLLRRNIKNPLQPNVENSRAISAEPRCESSRNSDGPSVSEILKPLHKYIKDNKCLLCGFMSKSKHQYRVRWHLATHLNVKSFECDVCGEFFRTPNMLAYHREKIHSRVPEECVCNECGKTFQRKNNLWKHQKKAHQSKKNICFVCGKRYAFANALKTHYRTHTGEKPYVCSVCGKGFSTSRALREHEQRHDVEKQFRCEICGKSYARKRVLTDHMNIHSLSAFKCDVCGKSFNYRSNLAQHKKVHSDVRPHCCEACGMTFKFPHHLRSHIKTHHGEILKT